MTIKDIFRYLVGAYYGMSEMDEYDLKEFVLNDIEQYIRGFVLENKQTTVDYLEEAEDVKNNVSLKVKLQDCLLVLPKVEAPLELILLVKRRIKNLNDDDDF